MMYNFLAPEWAIGSLNLHVSVVSRPWLYNNQVAGYIKEWVDTVSVATVRVSKLSILVVYCMLVCWVYRGQDILLQGHSLQQLMK